MPRQSDVVRAFCENDPDGPRRASNFSWKIGDSGKDYLCGGQNGNQLVLCIKEPIDYYKIYNNHTYRGSLGYNATWQQQHTVRQTIWAWLNESEYDYPDAHHHYQPAEPLLISNVDDL